MSEIKPQSRIDNLFNILYDEKHLSDSIGEKYEKLLNESLNGALFFTNLSKLLVNLLIDKQSLKEATPERIENLLGLSRAIQSEERAYILELSNLGIQQKAMSNLFGVVGKEETSLRRLKPTPKMLEVKKIIEESIKEELQDTGGY